MGWYSGWWDLVKGGSGMSLWRRTQCDKGIHKGLRVEVQKVLSGTF